MAFVAKPFSGGSFFFDVRSSMDRGLFAGIDGGLRYVVMDATFYRLGILVRPSATTFTAAATAVPAPVRVVANGQIFGTSRRDYCFTGPCAVQWQGEVMIGHAATAGSPASKPTFRHVGQWDGRAEVAYGIALGDPSTVVSPATYEAAMGSLHPLVVGGASASAAALGSWMTNTANTGKTAVGLHRGAQTVFVVVQEDGVTGGITVPDLIARLLSMNVNEAALADGSDSAALVVDRSIAVTPGSIKNNSIPSGLTFTLETLQLGPGSTLVPNPTTTDPEFQASTTFTGATGTIVQQTPAGLELTLTSLGASPTVSAADVLRKLGVTPPLVLKTTLTTLSSGVSLTKGLGPIFDATAVIAHVPNQVTNGEITGSLTIRTTRGLASFDVQWPVVV